VATVNHNLPVSVIPGYDIAKYPGRTEKSATPLKKLKKNSQLKNFFFCC
jgi:hypothetical protein